MNFTVIGAGLAGVESAWQIAKFGYNVTLIEMKPKKFSPAHKNEKCESSFDRRMGFDREPEESFDYLNAV